MKVAEPKTGFGLIDYWRMFVKRGLRLPACYFANAHWFDLIHRTDTHTWLPKANFREHPASFENGVLYMTSWTSEIRRAFNCLQQANLLDDPYIFIDIGCGKGKVCLMWKLLERRLNKQSRIVGIDYYEPLIKLARQNFFTVFQTEGEFYAADASTFDYSTFSDRLIVYLYNPFDESVLSKVLVNLPTNTVIIYNNPVHCAVMGTYGFKLINERHGWHPNTHTMIFLKR